MSATRRSFCSPFRSINESSGDRGEGIGGRRQSVCTPTSIAVVADAEDKVGDTLVDGEDETGGTLRVNNEDALRGKSGMLETYGAICETWT
jgi:hypothetical protein